jgi:hypothetical protein
LRLGKFRPHRHSAANYTVGQDPENGAGRGALYFFGSQIGALFSASGGVAVAFRAMLFEENTSSGDGLRIGFEGIAFGAGFFGSLGNFGVDRFLLLRLRSIGEVLR